MDKIIVKELKLFSYHGVNEDEKINGQNFVLDICVWLDLSKPCETDNVNDTVSYAKIIKKTREVFTAEKYDLLEKAAAVVIEALFKEFSAIEECEILLRKPQAPIKADFSYVAVEIRRKRDE